MERMTERETMTQGDVRRDIRRSMEREALSKGTDKVILSNLMLGGLVALAAVISMFGVQLSLGTVRDLTTLVVILYVITAMVYRNRYARGMMRGKRDGDYQAALSNYRSKRAAIDERGLSRLMPQFCREYKVRELQEYRSDLLVDVDMDYDEYKEKYMRKSDRRIMRLDLPLETRRVLIKCNHAKPLHLTSGMILNENGEAERHELLGKSGRERERSDKRKQMVERAVYILFGSAIAFNLIFDFSAAAILRWVVRMAPIAMAIISGDDHGYLNITVTETHFKNGQSAVIQIFDEWVEEGFEKTEESKEHTPIEFAEGS